MKLFKYMYYPVMMIAIAILFVSCQTTGSADNEREYRSGYKYGEKMAKQDAIDHACTGTIYNPSSNVWLQQQKHIKELEKTHSKKYIKGVYWGYKASFTEHMDIYCGSGKFGSRR